jgi:hypothetical protein
MNEVTSVISTHSVRCKGLEPYFNTICSVQKSRALRQQSLFGAQVLSLITTQSVWLTVVQAIAFCVYAVAL